MGGCCPGPPTDSRHQSRYYFTHSNEGAIRVIDEGRGQRGMFREGGVFRAPGRLPNRALGKLYLACLASTGAMKPWGFGRRSHCVRSPARISIELRIQEQRYLNLLIKSDMCLQACERVHACTHARTHERTFACMCGALPFADNMRDCHDKYSADSSRRHFRNYAAP